MRASLAGLVFLCLLGGTLNAAPNSPPETALADYVSAPDPSYAWQVHARYNILGAEIVELHLYSQTWQHVLWKHQLYLIHPQNVKPDVKEGLFVIAGGRWRDSYDTAAVPELPSTAAVFVALAQQVGTVVAVLAQDPFQPMFGLREDNLISYSFSRYLETGDADWPLLFPMVKAAVRGIDAVQAFTRSQWGLSLSRFAVVGGSKRGWATWLTGVVDPRAATLIPIVIDVLNFEAQIPHQVAIWGAPSEELEPYTKRGLLKLLSTDAGSALRRMVDPYSYRDRLTQPKLMVIGTNDAYFPIDALNLYWNGLRGEKYVLYVPNNGHNIDDFARLIPTVAAMNRQAAGEYRMPDLAWQFANDGSTLRLCMRADPAPTRVVLWSAHSSGKDFRDARFSSRPVGGGGAGASQGTGGQATGGQDEGAGTDAGVYEARVEPPASGYEAVFGELTFEEDGKPYTLSTNVRIIDSSGRPPAFSASVDGMQGVCAR